MEDLRFLSGRIHLVGKIIISDVIYSTGLGIHNRRNSKFPLPSPTFLRSKKKKMETKEKRKGFKAEIINRLSPRLKCYCFGHSRASRIQMVADNTFQCSMTPPLCHSNSLILINLKGHFITFINSIQATHIGFLIHTLGTLFKHVTDKYKTFAIILILGS